MRIDTRFNQDQTRNLPDHLHIDFLNQWFPNVSFGTHSGPPPTQNLLSSKKYFKTSIIADEHLFQSNDKELVSNILYSFIFYSVIFSNNI